MADSNLVPIVEEAVAEGWPNLTTLQKCEVGLAPVVFTILLSVALHYWPVKKKAPACKSGCCSDGKPDESTPLTGGQPQAQVIKAGTVRGDYSAPWMKTFDLTFLIGMALAFGLLVGATFLQKPDLWTNQTFWLYQLPKIGIMLGVSVLTGLLCRQFCDVDEKGYIITNKDSKFKVNYTRKVQHLAAYLVPLVVPMPASCNCTGTLETAWGQWFTLLCFLCMIKPVRENLSVFMLQFNSMDRPEDRPHTLKWIIAGNIIWGEILILFFQTLFTPYGQSALVFIFVYVTGLGDGLAEPVGIWFGRHKYKARSCGSPDLYERSFEGSACVFLSAMIFTSCYYFAFKNEVQFWACFFAMPPIMAVAEAVSPHTMDTPFLMGLGGGLLYLIIRML